MRLLQINVSANWGSTGKIAEQINIVAKEKGWDTYIAYGRYSNPSKSKLIRIGSSLDVYEHYAEHLFTDNDGLASRKETDKLIKEIEKIKPSVIHVHNIHDHWVNYRILFKYLNTLEIPILWTQHDCWSFTGGCYYFSRIKCEQWKKECTSSCPIRRNRFFRRFINQTVNHYNLKKALFLQTKHLTLVTVSKWLEGVIRESFLKELDIKTIYNGVDTDVFRPLNENLNVLREYGIENVLYVMGVASVWEERKGFADYCKLATIIPSYVKLVLVGLKKQKKREAEKYGIIGISRTNNVEELVHLYCGASVVLNLSYEETFGMTTVEGFACGTPGIVYNTTASPELINPETGIVVEPGDIEGVADAIMEILSQGKQHYSAACRKRAEEHFDKKECFDKYIDLYERLVKNEK